MEHARAEYISHHKEYSNPRIQDVVYDSEQLCLAEGADKSQSISDEIELRNLVIGKYRYVKLER